MKTYICLFFLLFCSVYSWGQSLEERMATAIDIGTYSEPFTYEDTQSTANFNCGFIPPTDMDDTRVFISKDIFYKLTVTQPMKIRASAKPSITDSGTVFLLNSSGILLRRKHGEIMDMVCCLACTIWLLNLTSMKGINRWMRKMLLFM